MRIAGRLGMAAAALIVLFCAVLTPPNAGASQRAQPQEVLRNWYGMVLELVRHTPTYSPPVASRAFGYLGVIAYEAIASGDAGLITLSGQLNGLDSVPAREAGVAYAEAVVLQAALAKAVQELFANTGPTGKRAIAAAEKRWRRAAAEGLPAEVVDRSEAYAHSLAGHILAWARADGGASVANLGFPLDYELTGTPASWVPTSPIVQQQKPLLPNWGENRTFAMTDGAACPVRSPIPYSEAEDSPFYKEALEVYHTATHLTPEQRAIARFWSDDPMLSATPPGHWMSIALQISQQKELPLVATVDLMARLGIALSDAFVACWHDKFVYDVLRPVTYIRRHIDPKWEPLLITPPFPEYPSGHSTQSAAAAEVLTAVFGEDFAFEDRTGERDGLPPRSFASFRAAATEAGHSRLYGGIHYRAAIEQGFEQGRCVAAHAVSLRTRK